MQLSNFSRASPESDFTGDAVVSISILVEARRPRSQGNTERGKGIYSLAVAGILCVLYSSPHKMRIMRFSFILWITLGRNSIFHPSTNGNTCSFFGLGHQYAENMFALQWEIFCPKKMLIGRYKSYCARIFGMLRLPSDFPRFLLRRVHLYGNILL